MFERGGGGHIIRRKASRSILVLGDISQIPKADFKILHNIIQ